MPGTTNIKNRSLSYGLFTCGIAGAILCFTVLLVKYGLKAAITPANALYLLALPPAWFYLRCEYHRFREQPHELARDAAMVVFAVFLACYLAPHLLRWLAFPQYAPGFAYYHHYALLALATALLLIRLHAYGGRAFCLLGGAAAGLTAFFFILTALPILSPVYYPISTAVAAVLFSVFLAVMARQDGLMKSILVKFANITDDDWKSLKQFGGLFLLCACFVLFMFGIMHPVNQPLTHEQLMTLLAGERMAAAETMLPQSNFFIGIALFVLIVTTLFLLFERTLEQEAYHRLTPLLWLSTTLMLVYTPCLIYLFYTTPTPVLHLKLQLITWILVSFIVGRFLNLSPLWLWGLFLLYPFLLPSIEGTSRAFVALHPLTFACTAIGLALLSVLTKKARILSTPVYPWPWSQKTALTPPFLLSAAAHLLVYIVFVQAVVNISYRHAWPTVLGMFLTAIPALIMAHKLRSSRHYLFFLPYTFAWVGLMLALQHHFPDYRWLHYLRTPHLISCGLFAALCTAVITDTFLPCRDRYAAYRTLKYMIAAAILILISYAYLTTRNIEIITWQRFVTSGILTLGAGLYFRHLIRHEHKGRCYPFFAWGITLSLLCGVILPVKYLLHVSLTPTLLFWLLTIPPLWFVIRSEYNRATGRIHASGRDVAIVLCACLLALYIIPHLFRFLLLPDYAPSFFHYLQHAPLALLIGLLFIRLHSQEGGAWLNFTGLTVIITAFFFLGVRSPEWIFGELPVQPAGKTFEFFTLIAITLSYIFLISTRERGLLRKGFTALGDIRAEQWPPLRAYLFVLLLTLSHGLFLMTLTFAAHSQKLIGVIFLLLAGLWMYTGYALRHAGFYSVAYAEIVAAIFSCRWFDSYWKESWIIWLLVALFILLLPIYSLFLKRRHPQVERHLYVWLAISAVFVIYEHLTVYGLHSRIGIIPLFVLWIAALFVPVGLSARTTRLFPGFLMALMYCPAAFFVLLRGIPRVILVAVVTACLMLAYRIFGIDWLDHDDVTEMRVIHHLHWFFTRPYTFTPVFLLATVAVFVIHAVTFRYWPDLIKRSFYTMLVVQLILVVYWFYRAQKSRLWWLTIMAETMIIGVILTLRQGVPDLLDIDWTINWDMAIGLFAAFTLVAARPFLQGQDPAIRIPLRFTLFGLPIVMLLYAFNYAPGFDTISRVILLYSVLFLWQAYSEKDRYVLAYAFLGFNAYLGMLFFSHEIRSPQAYITPVCLSILILVQIFRDITSRTTANLVRGAALFVLLGTAMLEAIVNNYHSPWAHFIVITLSILAMTSAGVLHIRIFAAAGLFCFLIDMIAIIYIVLSQQDTETLKVVVGMGLTLGGGLILTGYILYRKNKERIETQLDRMKKTFSAWE